jgi:hypothetical protein
VDLRGSTLNLEKQAKAAAAVPYTVDQGFLLRAARSRRTNFRISAKLAAIEAIVRVFPSRSWINY